MHYINSDGILFSSVKDNGGKFCKQQHTSFQWGNSIYGSWLVHTLTLTMSLVFWYLCSPPLIIFSVYHEICMLLIIRMYVWNISNYGLYFICHFSLYDNNNAYTYFAETHVSQRKVTLWCSFISQTSRLIKYLSDMLLTITLSHSYRT